MNPRAALAIAILSFALHVDAQMSQSYLLDPFAQATSVYGVAVGWNEAAAGAARKITHARSGLVANAR